MKNKKKIVIAVAAFFAVMTLIKLFGALLFPIAVLLVIACIKLKKKAPYFNLKCEHLLPLPKAINHDNSGNKNISVRPVIGEKNKHYKIK